jgi:uncharacterized protein
VTEAALYDCIIRHVRTTPVANSFSYHSYQWLVDLDALPRLHPLLRPLARFVPSDHLGDPAHSIRQNVDRFLALHDIDLHGGTVRMLANARVFGYAFNPLSVYWCHHASGELACVLAEVHNTYGQRHCYVLRTDSRGRATAAKAFYVSPFYPVEGRYQMSLPEPGDRLSLAITFWPSAGPPFVASVRGTRRPATSRQVLATAIRQPWPTAAVTARIHAQGVKLYARGLPVVPRPARHPQRGV